MPHQTAVINIVGLSESLLGEASPHINAFRQARALRRLKPVLPAVTCSVQSSMLTGQRPSEHGIVGNGWYNREQCEVQFWKQSNHLVRGEKVWETARARDHSVTCANMFWWFNMYSSVDWSVTPRPQYKADGRKVPDVYSHPADLRDWLQAELGQFPLFNFWGPGSSIKSSEWIAEASMRVIARHDPTLTLIYLPHLDYCLQKLGPNAPQIAQHVADVDAVVGRLIDFLRDRNIRIVLLSEYGIQQVSSAVAINRCLRESGWLQVRNEQGGELLDAGASTAFAVADHQIAHVYVNSDDMLDSVAERCRSIDGVEQVLTRAEQRDVGIAHERSGDLVLIAEPHRWFSYDYWVDDRAAPDFARTVDIHRKPGYDPLELFLDPALSFPTLTIARKLLMKKLGFRSLMNVIPLDTSLVQGSHGRTESARAHRPLLISELPDDRGSELPCTAVRDVILDHVFRDA